MKNLVFILWLLAWPLVSSLTHHLYLLDGGQPSQDTIAIAIIDLAIWIGVASLVYEGKKKED